MEPRLLGGETLFLSFGHVDGVFAVEHDVFKPTSRNKARRREKTREKREWRKREGHERFFKDDRILL